jgi:hypothetical protein
MKGVSSIAAPPFSAICFARNWLFVLLSSSSLFLLHWSFINFFMLETFAMMVLFHATFSSQDKLILSHLEQGHK